MCDRSYERNRLYRVFTSPVDSVNRLRDDFFEFIGARRCAARTFHVSLPFSLSPSLFLSPFSSPFFVFLSPSPLLVTARTLSNKATKIPAGVLRISRRRVSQDLCKPPGHPINARRHGCTYTWCDLALCIMPSGPRSASSYNPAISTYVN